MTAPTPPRPRIIIAQADGSGTPPVGGGARFAVPAIESTRSAVGGPTSVTWKSRLFTPATKPLLIVKGCWNTNEVPLAGRVWPVATPLSRIAALLSADHRPVI